MKKWRRLSALLIAIAILLINCNLDKFVNAADQNAELIPNGDFENLDENDFPTDWQVFAIDNGTGSVSVVDNAGRNGNVVKIDTTNQYAISGHDITGKIAVESDTKYKLTYWVKIVGDAEDDAIQRTFIRQHNAEMGDASENAYYLLSDYAITGSCEWKQVEAYFTTASDCKYIYLWMSLYNGGTLYLDDVSMEEVPVKSDMMVENGDFEKVTGTCPDGFMGLSIDGGTGTVSSVDGGFSGNKSVCITPTSGDYALFNHDLSPIEVKGSTNYRISYMVKIPGEGTTLKPFIRQLTSTGGNTSENTYYAKYEYKKTGVCDWTQVDVDFTTAPDARKIHIWLIASSGEVYIDDLTMFKYTPKKEEGIINGDFSRVSDTGFMSWGFWNGNAGELANVYKLNVEGDGYSGNSAKITKTAGDSFAVLQQEQNILVKADTTYEFSYWVKTEAAASMKQYVTIRQYKEDGTDTSANAYITPQTVLGNTEWTQVSFRFKTEADAAQLNYWFIFTGADDGATAWYDNVAIQESADIPDDPTDEPSGGGIDDKPEVRTDIVNGDFSKANENKFTGWTFWNDGSNETTDMYKLSVDENGYAGNSARITKVDGNGFCVLEQDVPISVTANTTYKFSYWVKTEKAASMKQYVTIRQYKEGGVETEENAYLTPQQLSGNMKWTQVQFRFKTEADTSAVNFWFIFTGVDDGATVWYDNIVLQESEDIPDEPTGEGTDGKSEVRTDIVNGDFSKVNENNFTGWTFWNDGSNETTDMYTLSVDENGYSGNSAKIKKIAGSGFCVLEQNAPISVTANTTYKFSYWVKTEKASSMKQYVTIRQYKESGVETEENAYLTPQQLSGNMEWTQVQFRFTTEADTSSANFWFIFTGTDDGATVWYDNVSLEYVREIPGSIVNGEFSEVNASGFYGWNFWNDGSNSVADMYTLSVDRNGYSGNSAKIKKIAGSGFCVLHQDTPLMLKPNTTYEFSYWVKTEKATSMKQYVTVRQNKEDGTDTSLNTYLTLRQLSGNVEWTQVAFRFVTEADTSKVDFWFIFTGDDNGATVWYDNVTLRETEPSTDKEILGFDVEVGGMPVGWTTNWDSLTPSDVEYGMTEGVEGKAVSVKKLTDAEGVAILVSKTLAVEPNTSYEVSFWIKSNDASAYNYIFIHQYAENGDAENAWLWPPTEYWQYGKTDWKKVTIPFTTSSNAIGLEFRVCSGGDKGTEICYDSFSLTKLTDNANLDFESVNKDGSPENWFYASREDESASMTVDSTMSYTGKNSLHITKNNSKHAFMVQSSTYLDVKDAMYYEFSYYVKSRDAVSNARAKLNFVIYDKTGVALTTLNTVNAYLSASDDVGDEWKRYSMTLIVPSGGCKGQLSLNLSPGTAEVWIDHITLKEIGSVRDEIAYWDDFTYGDRDGNVAGWKVSGEGATLTNVDGKAKLQAKDNVATMSTELVSLRSDYVYEVTGNYTAQNLTEAVLRVKYFDTSYREMTSLVHEETISLESSGAFNTYFTASSCTTAEISLETKTGTLILDDITLKVSDRPATSSDWRGKWVWFNENAAVSAVRVNRYFRQSFEIDQSITSAIMQITCDDKFVLYINGVKVDEELSDVEDTWKNVHVLDIAQYLKQGKNTFAVEAYNVVSSAGLLFDARIDLGNGVRLVVESGADTLVSPKHYDGWNQTNYNDSQWENVMVIGAVPVLPWAEVAFDNTYFVDAAFELIEATTVEEETECGDYAYINLKMELAKKLTTVPEFMVKIWKRNTNIEVTSSELELIDGSEPTEWPVGEPFTVKFKMKIPDFINAGRYTLQLDMNKFKITNDLIYDNKFMDIRAVRTIEQDPLTTEVADYNGAPTLMIDGVPEAFMSFLLPISEERHVDTAPSDMSSKGNMNLYLSFDTRLTDKLWKKDGSVDFDEFDKRVIRSMSFNPDGYFMLSIDIDSPDWWEELHPEELCVDNNGNVTGVSLTSKLFREEAGEVVRQLIEHAMEQSYWNKIFGIRLTGTKTAEWLHYGAGLNGSIDYSPSALNGFREWLTEKYGTDASLQKAWNNRKVTLATASVPTYEERTTSEYVSLLNPKTQKNIIDFQDYMGSCASDVFLHMCQIAKEVTNDQLIVGGYHGYVWNTYSYEGNDITHSSIQKVLDSEYVDFICGPQNYNERDLGIPGAWMSTIDGVHASGKLFIQEQDNRTITAPGVEWPESDSGVGKTYTTEDTINQIKRDYSQIITKNAGMWFYDMDGGWFHDDQIYELSRIINEEADLSILTDKASTSEVAVFVDEKTYEYSTYEFGATYQIYTSLYLEQRFNLGTMGAPYDVYRISDLCGDNVLDYKVNIILSPYQITDEQREAIDKHLKKDGKILIWVFAPGISDGSENDVTHISELTGIELAMKKEKCRLNVTLSDTKNALLEGLKGVSYGVANEEVGPYIYVNDKKAEILGYLYDTDEDRRQVGLAVKEMGDYTSIYSAAPNLPNHLLQNILKEAGVHLYTENRDDILYANEHYVAIHSAFAGKRIVTLPENHSVYDVYANEFVSMDTDEFVVELRDGESKLYRLMTPNTYAVTVTRNSGGTVSDFGLTEVQPGASMAIKVEANEGYHVKSITVNGEDVDVSKGKIKLSEINENMVVKVKFAKGDVAKTTDTDTNGFTWWPIMLITIGSIIIIGGIIFFVICQKKKKQKSENVVTEGEAL